MVAWAGYLGALSEDPAGVKRVLETKIVATASRNAQKPSVRTELAWVIEVETAHTWRPDIVNPTSRATGLIQFMPDTAKSLGTTVEALAVMSRTEQAEWVQKYFNKVVKDAIYVGDVYMMVAAPAFTGQPDDTVVYAKGTKAWEQNPAWHPAGGGDITAGSIRRVGTPPTLDLPDEGGAIIPVPKPKPKPKGGGGGGGAGLLFVLLGAGLLLSGKGKRRGRR